MPSKFLKYSGFVVMCLVFGGICAQVIGPSEGIEVENANVATSDLNPIAAQPSTDGPIESGGVQVSTPSLETSSIEDVPVEANDEAETEFLPGSYKLAYSSSAVSRDYAYCDTANKDVTCVNVEQWESLCRAALLSNGAHEVFWYSAEQDMYDHSAAIRYLRKNGGVSDIDVIWTSDANMTKTKCRLRALISGTFSGSQVEAQANGYVSLFLVQEDGTILVKEVGSDRV